MIFIVFNVNVFSSISEKSNLNKEEKKSLLRKTTNLMFEMRDKENIKSAIVKNYILLLFLLGLGSISPQLKPDLML